MDTTELRKWKTKLLMVSTVLSALVGLITYTVTVTLLYANVVKSVELMQRDLAHLVKAAQETKFDNLREHDQFAEDIRELQRQAVDRR